MVCRPGHMAREKYDPLIRELAASFDGQRVKALSYQLQLLSSEDALTILPYFFFIFAIVSAVISLLLLQKYPVPVQYMVPRGGLKAYAGEAGTENGDVSGAILFP